MQREYVHQFHHLMGAMKQINDTYHVSKGVTYRDINRIDLSVLGFAAYHPEMSIKNIREKLGVPQSTLSSSITRLSKKGMIRRVINENDSRSFHLVLTETGRQLRQAHEDVNLRLATDMLTTLGSDEERKLLMELLSKVVSRMS